ncbi:MAG: heparan-alpha-glucosaminide N-acetyltransferase [Finegoldia sp.]|nr:heparan-alpha-glucosaminide N-acetyltransferase [Finegoldia sp.]
MKRLHYIDKIRGLAIINMVLFHLCFNLVYMKGLSLPFFEGSFGDVWGFLIRASFITISGISFNFSKNNLRHSLKLMAAALIISLGSYVFDRELFIKFGIIHFLALASLIAIGVDKIFRKDSAKIFFPLSILVFTLSFAFMNKSIYIGTNALAFIGLYNRDFRSADFFPLVPWYFLYLAGYFSYYVFDYRAIDSKESPLSRLGQKSLLIYLIHQPIIVAIMAVLGRI